MSGEPDIEGYRRCRVCDCLVLLTTWYQTNGICFEHFLAGINPNVTQLEVINKGKLMKIGRRSHAERLNARGGRKPRPASSVKASDEWRERSRLAAAAREVAAKRLTRLHPALYHVLLCEERIKRGLDATISAVEGYLVHGIVTYQPNSIYPRVDDEPGVVDGDQAEDEAASP